MSLNTATFVAGVGVLVTLDIAVLTISVANARKVGVDDLARTAAEEAEQQAETAHERLTLHLRSHHDEDVQTARDTADEDVLPDGGFPVEDEPDGDVSAPHHFYVGLIVAAFGFVSVWDLYPVTGAGMAVLGLLVALDDVASHAFGVWTPLDWLWRAVIFPRLPSTGGDGGD